MAKATICTYPQSDHVLPYWKYVLLCCYKFTCINLPDQETYREHEETTPSIRFHIYHIIARCTAHGINILKDRTICYMHKQESSSDEFRKSMHHKRASDDGDRNF